jgi:hypothetical protein
VNGPPKDLVARRDRLLALPPLARIEAIESARDPRELVRALPAQDLFLTLAEAGINDALVLLEHASVPQLEFLFDLGAWDRDAFDPARFARWIGAVAVANPDRVARWLSEGDEAAVLLALGRVFQVFKLDESSEPAFWPPDRPVPTLDGTYYLEARDDVPEEAAAALWEALARLRSTDSQAYEALLEQVLWAVPAEREEEAYERRASRLAEKGFPPFDEAIEAWAAGPAADPEFRREASRRALVAASARQLASGPPDAGAGRHLPAPLDDAGRALAQAVAGLDPAEQRRVLSDLLRLGNRFAVAGLGDLAELETHREGLRIALSHAALGLHELGGARAAALGPALLATVPVPDLVRAGTGAVMQRAERARRLDAGWLARVAGGRERLDPESEELLNALLLPRPAFGAPGVAPRPFRHPDDLAAADEALDAIEALGSFVEQRLGVGADGRWPELDPLPAARGGPLDLDWPAVALTAIARAALGGPPRPAPLDPGEARRALERLLEGEDPRRPAPRLFALAAELGLEPAAAHLARRLADELSELPPGEAPDPRFVRSLLLRWED